MNPHLHIAMRRAIGEGKDLKQAADELGICRAHAYRVAEAAGIRKFLLTPMEAAIIEDRRSENTIKIPDPAQEPGGRPPA